jgi:type II secretory pathway pseudopilin PulG
MNRLLAALVLAGCLAGPARGADLAELLAGLPPETDLVMVSDLAAWGRVYEKAWAELQATPAVAENPEARNLLGMQKALVDSALGTLRTQLGLDPLKDLGWVALGLVFPRGPGEPRGVILVEGKFPADLPARLRPELVPEKLDGLEVWSLVDMKLVVEAGRRAVLASDLALLKQALSAREIPAELARHLPEMTGRPGPELLLRLAVGLPPAAREELLAEPDFPAVSLVGGLRWLQLDLDQAGIQLALGCEGEKSLRKAERLLTGLGEAFLAGSYTWRTYAYAALGLDLGDLPMLPVQLKGMLANRASLEKSVEQYLPRPTGRPEVKRLDGVARLVVPEQLTRGGLMISGVLAAVAVPAFIKYVRKAKESEAPENLRKLASLQEAHRAKHGAYRACGRVPAKTPGEQPVPWPGDKCFEALGFEPEGPVHFSYELEIDEDGFRSFARSDLDGDGVERVLRYDSRTRAIELLTPDTW